MCTKDDFEVMGNIFRSYAFVGIEIVGIKTQIRSHLNERLSRVGEMIVMPVEIY